MGRIEKPEEVKLIIGMISNEAELFDEVINIFEKELGAVDFESEILPFDHTDYYEEEMGKGLKRRFYSFSNILVERRARREKK